MQSTLYLPLLAMVLGGILHSLTDDGASSILAHFNITWRVPTAALPLSIFLVSIASGLVDARVGGADWQHALVTSLTTVFSGLFGAVAVHAVTNKTPPKGPPGPLTGVATLLLLCLALGSTACASTQAAVTGSCLAIQLADDACALIDVPSPDGGVQHVKVSGKQLRELASPDGGAK